MLTPVIVAVGQLVPDDGADPAIVQRSVGQGAEVRELEGTVLAGMAMTPGPDIPIPCPGTSPGTPLSPTPAPALVPPPVPPAPALAPPGHAAAPHSLRELGVVEGGLQDASGEH